MALRCGFLVVFVAGVAGCANGPSRPGALTALHEAALADSVSALARASEASWKLVSCADVRPAVAYWDGSPPGLVHAHEGTLATFSDSAWAKQIRSSVCASGSGESLVDTVVVSIVSPDVVTATMRYHAVLRDSAGTTTHREGQILRVFRRTPDGWKIRVSMSTHSDLGR